MVEERRRAVRFQIPEGLEAKVNAVPVRLLELSTIGARIEHEERFALNAPQLSLLWKGRTTVVRVRVARSEIAGRRESHLIYHSGLQFIDADAAAQTAITSILGESQPVPANPQAALPIEPVSPSLDDSWIRQATFLKHDTEDELPYAQFRLTPSGWQKAYIARPTQPDDGFTISRNQRDFAELQRTYELADEETRSMMRIAIASQLNKQ